MDLLLLPDHLGMELADGLLAPVLAPDGLAEGL